MDLYQGLVDHFHIESVDRNIIPIEKTQKLFKLRQKEGSLVMIKKKKRIITS